MSSCCVGCYKKRMTPFEKMPSVIIIIYLLLSFVNRIICVAKFIAGVEQIILQVL